MNHCWQKTFLTRYLLFTSMFFIACNSKKTEPPVFDVLNSGSTGLNFTNKLISTDSFNVFKYMYFYNGAGIGAGDFNNDGNTDLFFASNQGSNKMYLNEGKLHFKDVTNATKIPQDGGWSTGVSVVDINSDGLLDLYICRVGKHEILESHNLFLICQGIDATGIPFYADKAVDYGLAFSGFSTQAAFLDYDADGDLDMYLLNHFIHQNGNFGIRSQLLVKSTPLSGDRLYRNEGNGKFNEVTKQAGINSSVLGYGLGISVADINVDGYPDIYIANDFHENDYLYINQHDGTFKEQLTNQVMHTSQYSMGVDIADINNDAYPEIITMDMLPYDPYILKRSLGEDSHDLFYQKVGYGYHYQYTRNNLQFNRRNGVFSEAGLFSGVASTDWSWAPLWIDFDNDGLKDLFISNGIPKRMNDIDYITYISNQDIQDMIRDNKIGRTNMKLIDKFPRIKIPNKFFKNNGGLAFTNMESQVGNNQSTYSNGSVYADFDNDGDLDIIVNNIDDPALLYQNRYADKKTPAYLNFTLQGPAGNINALGAKLVLYANGGVRTYEKYAVRGFLSSMESPVHIGLENTQIDSIFIIWPDNSYQPILIEQGVSSLTLNYRKGLPKFNYKNMTGSLKNFSTPMIDVTRETGLLHKHQENPFSEFDREPLIPHMFSTEGPGLAVADINHDGFEDVFIGSSKREKSVIFLQNASGNFYKSLQPSLENDSVFEDVDACWADFNNDGHVDLAVASGGNEYYGADLHLTPRIYLNDGKANLTRVDSAFGAIYLTASCIVPNDFNQDGLTDLFIGGRSVPWDYGQVPRSYLFQNKGNGQFTDVTQKYAPQLSFAGFVTQAQWFDIDKDGDKDLVICSEWGGIDAFISEKGRLVKKSLTDKKGWWNFILPCDVNNDGNIDLIAGNLGHNSRLKASAREPVQLYYDDFDGNGKKEQVLTYYLNGKQIPFANKAELERQMPVLRKKFLYAEDFARSSLQDIFTTAKLRAADVLTADYFSNAILVNRGNLRFDVQEMPWEAQLSPYKDAVAVHANQDSLPDILLFGNYYENNIEMGRYDADFGTVLLNQGNNSFTCSSINGLQVKGQVRKAKQIRIAQSKEAFILARNNDSTIIIQFNKTPVIK
ncbi:MAG: VCBS repeat-containing protein [Chitinophagaceae bacterium]